MLRPVLCLGPSAVSLTGETLATQEFIARIEQECRSHGVPVRSVFVMNQSSGFFGLLSRVRSYCLLLILSVRYAISGMRPNIYLVCPSQRAIFIIAALITLIRPFANRIVCHHHGRRWFVRRNTILAHSVFSHRVRTLTQCDALVEMLRAQYPKARPFPMSNAWLVPKTIEKNPSATTNPNILGYISNLTFEKGIDSAIETLVLAHQVCDDFILHVAGKPQSTDVATYIHEAIQRGTPLSQLGFVNGKRKTEFFETIHVLLFPTRYAIEAEPLVTLEALAHGVPVLSTCIGCLGRNITKSGGAAFPEASNFPESALQILLHWRASPESYAHARRCARERHSDLQEESRLHLKENLLYPLTAHI